ncbi:MAG: hypothetical protein V4450_10635 [Bacteroidota bacterium]
MADRSFEQKVKEELADLRIKPDASVWIGVASELRKEKKRRWFIWLMLLLAGCGTASIWTYFQFRQPAPLAENGKMAAIVKPVTTSQSSIPNEKEKVNPVKGVAIKPENAIVLNGTHREKNTFSWQATVDKRNAKSVEPSNQTVTVHTGIDQEPAKQKELAMVGNHVSEEKKIEEVSMNGTSQDKQVFKDSLQLITHEEKQIAQTIVDTPQQVLENLTPTLIKAIVQAPKKWNWNIHLAAGYGNTITALLPAGKSGNDVYASSPSTGVGGPGSIGTPGGGGLQTASGGGGRTAAFSFNAGVEMSKLIGKRNRLGMVIDYSFYQTNATVGNRIDSTSYFSSVNLYNRNGYYYNNGSSVNYREQYHFLTAGLAAVFPARLFKQLQMRWQVGAGLQFLIASNGLQYDAATNRFFRNNSLIPKIQPRLSFGFDFGIGKQSLFYVGPYWQYTTANLAGAGTDKRHLVLSALKLSYILPEKKNKVQR